MSSGLPAAAAIWTTEANTRPDPKSSLGFTKRRTTLVVRETTPPINRMTMAESVPPNTSILASLLQHATEPMPLHCHHPLHFLDAGAVSQAWCYSAATDEFPATVGPLCSPAIAKLHYRCRPPVEGCSAARAAVTAGCGREITIWPPSSPRPRRFFSLFLETSWCVRVREESVCVPRQGNEQPVMLEPRSTRTDARSDSSRAAFVPCACQVPGSCHGSWWVRHVRLTGRGRLRRRPRGFRLRPCAMITRRYPMAGRHFSQDSTWRGHAAIDWGLGVVLVVRWLSVCNDGNETRPGCCPVGIGGQQATAACGRQHAASTHMADGRRRRRMDLAYAPAKQSGQLETCRCNATAPTCRPFCESAMQPGTRSRRIAPLLWRGVLSWV
jgi:hypothetical protein